MREGELEKVRKNGGILITTYGMIPTNEDIFVSHNWDFIVLDEGHKIKNPSIKLTTAVKRIPGKFRLLLSGTPIQNNLHEMWSLFDYVCPGLLGTSRTFKGEFENPINLGCHKKASLPEIELGLELARQLKEIIAPYFLRREKKEVFKQKTGSTPTASRESRKPSTPSGSGAENRTPNKSTPNKEASLQLVNKQLNLDNSKNGSASPKTNGVSPSKVSSPLNTLTLKSRKNDFVIWVHLSPQQIQLYEDFTNSSSIVQRILDTSESPLAAITILKKITNHPLLLHAKLSSLEGMTLPEYITEMQDGRHDIEKLIEMSGKLNFFSKLVTRLQAEGERVVIFSQSIKMLDMIGHVLFSKSCRFLRIDGRVTSYMERQKLIDTYNTERDNYFAFLLTTQVGGLGISLTSATRVIIFDPGWNGIDDQAVDRVYRIGQTRDVVVYRLITCGTIEEKIYRKQVFKGCLMKKVVEKSDPYRYFTSEELRDLLSLDDPTHSPTQVKT